MKLLAVELRRISIPLVTPFRTSFGTETNRDVLLVRVVTPESEGWGECVAGPAPLYSYEHVSGAQQVLRDFLVPRLLGREDVSARSVGVLLGRFKGHPMAKGALEMALLDAELRAAGLSLARHLGGVREHVDCGVSVGIEDDLSALIDEVERFLSQGYKRIKLKIEPGWDVDPVRAVRARFGTDVPLQVDANAAYSITDARHLARLDEFGLVMIEQPLSADDVRGHARLGSKLKTPICLDESITSARAAVDAISMGACTFVNIKAGRVGGYLEAALIHDACRAHGVVVWCGGMLETGLGRAANVALASLPNFLLPGDTSASDRYYDTDVTEPFVLENGQLAVPTGPGLGVTPLPAVLREVTTSVETISRPAYHGE